MNSPQGPTPPSGGGPLPPNLPEPEIVKPRRWLPSLVWIVPVVVVAVGLMGVGLAVTRRRRGGGTVAVSDEDRELVARARTGETT